MVALSNSEISTLIAIERGTACVSVLGTLSLLGTFLIFKEFRTLSNTLIFYASFANLFANVAALIGGSALSEVDGPLCQFQGFLLEMFMQSDPMWSLAMAVNVYLVFFRRYDAYRLKRLSWIYGVLCYGVPFIPAIVCLLVKTSKKGKVYGNATLWCWIDNDWAPLRIYSYYGPIWVAILITFIIYTRVGIEIFQKRSELRGAMSRVEGNGSLTSGTGKPEPIVGIRTTEIEVTHDTRDKEGNSPTRDNSKHSQKDQYSVTISAREQPPQTPRTGILTKRPTSMDKIKWAYTRCAVLFAISILITWVPASVNRVYGLRYPSKPSFALNIGSAVVLPLQGFWNTIIYFTTSLQICARVMSRLRSRENFRVIEIVHLGGSRHGDGASGERNESQIEFSTSRSVISVDSLPSL